MLDGKIYEAVSFDKAISAIEDGKANFVYPNQIPGYLEYYNLWSAYNKGDIDPTVTMYGVA